jgi:uncharacterized protein
MTAQTPTAHHFLAARGAAMILLCLLMTASLAAPPTSAPSKHIQGVELPNHVLQVNWEELLPPGAESGTAQAPPPVHTYLGESGPAAMQTGSAAVNPDIEGLTLRIPGFIVPLDENAQGLVTEFFLVPYYGACIHVPPPPPNQMVYVKPAKPVLVKDTFNAYWITGIMHVQVRSNHIASSSYLMKVEKVEVYE